MCAKLSPPRRVYRLSWNFVGIYNSTWAIVWGTFQLPVGTSNRKLAVMEVLSSFFDSSNLEATKTIFVRVCLYTRAWEAKIFKSLWRLPWSKYRKRRKVLTLQNCTLFSSSIFLTSGSDIFNFLFTKNSKFSGYEVSTGSRKIPPAIARVELYITPKFHANRSTRLGDSFSHIKCIAS